MVSSGSANKVPEERSIAPSPETIPSWRKLIPENTLEGEASFAPRLCRIRLDVQRGSLSQGRHRKGYVPIARKKKGAQLSLATEDRLKKGESCPKGDASFSGSSRPSFGCNERT